MGMESLQLFLAANIVVLDTCVCRELRHEIMPCWYNLFVEMKNAGIEFCLSDVSYAELLNQFMNNQILSEEWQRIMLRLSVIISSTFPILPGNGDLFRMLNIQDDNSNVLSFDFKYEKLYSQGCFYLMCNCKNANDLENTAFRIQLSQNETQRFTCLTSKFNSAIQDARNYWESFVKHHSLMFRNSRNHFDNNKTVTTDDIKKAYRRHSNEFQQLEMKSITAPMLDSVDKAFTSVPRFSIRADLVIQYLALILTRASKEKEPYNPCSLHHINDGLDLSILHTLIIPCRICTIDRMKGPKSINSFQRDWIVTPEELERLWNEGKLKKLAWPSR